MSNPEYFCCFGIVGLDGLGRRGRSFYEMGETPGWKKLLLYCKKKKKKKGKETMVITIFLNSIYMR